MIVAEVGINHMGDEEYAKTYVDRLSKSKIDAITFQVREKRFYKKVKWQSFLLSDKFYKNVIPQIRSSNKKVGIAISDIKKIDFFESLDVDFYKILSKDLSNKKLLTKVLNTTKNVYVSTGMSPMEDIDTMLERFTDQRNQISLIHTQLTHSADQNLRMIKEMRKKFNLPVGFGNHCENLNVLYTALAFQPSDFFVYVKGLRFNSTKHPDENHAISIYSIDNFVINILELSQALGTGVKSGIENQIKGME